MTINPQQILTAIKQIGNLSDVNAPIFGGLRRISASLNGGKLPDYTNSTLPMAQRMNDLIGRTSIGLDAGFVDRPPIINDYMSPNTEAQMAKQFGQTLQASGQEAKNAAYIKQLAKQRQVDQGLGNNMLGQGKDLVQNPSNVRQFRTVK